MVPMTIDYNSNKSTEPVISHHWARSLYLTFCKLTKNYSGKRFVYYKLGKCLYSCSTGRKMRIIMRKNQDSLPATDTPALGPRIFATPPKLSPTQQLLMKLEAYQNMPEDERWPPAKWPEEKAFEDAYNFIQHLDLNSIPMPIITLADDGEVNFLWKTPSVHVDLGFYGTGTYSYFACHTDGRRFISETEPAQKGLVSEVIQLFKV